MNRILPFFLGILFTSSLFGETWTLDSGPRVVPGIPSPILWNSPVWTASYRSSRSQILVYGVTSRFFRLNPSQELACAGLKGLRADREEKIFIYLSGKFLIVLPGKFSDPCGFLQAFQKEWDRLQSVSLNRGLVTLPPRVEINPGAD